MGDLAAGLEALLAQVADQPVPMALLARLLLTRGETDRAVEIAERAIAIAPDHPEVWALAAGVLSHDIPHWHLAIVRDLARNAAYDAALRRAVHPDSRVLEIGAGTGLLSMMAARAGASEVLACEMNRRLAAVASRIVANNGFADRIRIVAKHSDDLRLGVDLAQPADVLVSEIISNDMLGQRVLPILERARPLLRSDAQVIPERGAIRVALAEDLEADREMMGVVDGFDLSAFNVLAPPHYHVKVGASRLVLRSPAETLFSFDFRAARFATARSEVALTATGGRVGGIVQWIRLDMDKHSFYENAPATGSTSCWDALFYPLRKLIELHAGERVVVRGAHDRESIRIWAEIPDGKR